MIETHTDTEEPQDPRGTFESTKHDRYSAILPNMRDGFYTCRRVESQCERIDCTEAHVTAPGEVFIPDLLRVDHVEAVSCSFG